MKKAQILEHWQGVHSNQKIKISPVPYKHTGTTYHQDGIRLTGSMEFIDSVLSRLKDLLDYENFDTRLQLNYQESKDRETQKPLGSYNCYIQVHQRGNEARMINNHFRVIASRGY